MSGKSPIQWTEATWNPTTGCTRVSAGCDHCYAFQLHDQRHIAWKRGRWDSAPAQYHVPFSRVQLMPERLNDPLHWRKPRRVFVNSMSDLFHEAVPDEFIAQVFRVMLDTPQHTYQILTKRPERMLTWRRDFWPIWSRDLPAKFIGTRLVLPNVWLGVSVENQQAADERIPLLLETPAAVRFLSCEPLLGPVDLREYIQLTDTNIWDYGEARTWGYDSWNGGFATMHQWSHVYDPQPGIHWVIIGGESGNHARSMNLAWVESMLSACEEAGVAPFVKQLGSVWAKEHHASDSHGGAMADWPEHLRVREYPQTGGAVVIARQRPPKIPNENQEVDDASL